MFRDGETENDRTCGEVHSPKFQSPVLFDASWYFSFMFSSETNFLEIGNTKLEFNDSSISRLPRDLVQQLESIIHKSSMNYHEYFAKESTKKPIVYRVVRVFAGPLPSVKLSNQENENYLLSGYILRPIVYNLLGYMKMRPETSAVFLTRGTAWKIRPISR